MKIRRDVRDDIFSKMIRERDKRCQFCGRSGRLEASHFWGRGNKSVRFDAKNVDALCFQCHANNEGSKQGFYRDWKIQQLGQEEYDALEYRARGTANYREYEKKIILKQLKDQYANELHLQKDWKGIEWIEGGHRHYGLKV